MGDCQLWVAGCVAVKEADPPVRITPRDAGVPELYQIVAECRERAGILQKQRVWATKGPSHCRVIVSLVPARFLSGDIPKRLNIDFASSTTKSNAANARLVSVNCRSSVQGFSSRARKRVRPQGRVPKTTKPPTESEKDVSESDFASRGLTRPRRPMAGRFGKRAAFE